MSFLTATTRTFARSVPVTFKATPLAAGRFLSSSSSPSSPVASAPRSAGEVVQAPKLAFDVAKNGSNQQSLETPRNGTEYALATLDKMANWARTGSMWPMVNSPFFPCHPQDPLPS